MRKNDKWLAAFVISFSVIVVKFFKPAITANEYVYLINPKKLIEPDFLVNDWTFSNLITSHFIYDLFVCPLFLFFEPLTIALILRIFLWILILWALIKLIKKLGFEYWEFFFGFLIWILGTQSYAADEWIFNGAESKCVAYFFLFISLYFLFKKKIVTAALFAGISICFHILVGGWGALGISIAVIFSIKEYSFKEIIFFFMILFLTSLPGTLPSFLSLMGGGQGLSDEVYRINLLRNPHHLDPQYFMSWDKWIWMTLTYLLTLYFIHKIIDKNHRTKLSVFLTTLMIVFLIGIFFKLFDNYSFLIFYPFRLGPLFLAIFFSLGAVRFLHLYLTTKTLLIRSISILTLCLLIVYISAFNMPNKILKSSYHFLKSWKSYTQNTHRNDFDEMMSWVKKNTHQNSVFVAPPWRTDFWLKAERAMVVNFKSMPVSIKSLEWYSRMVALNGGKKIENKGFKILNELEKNYPELTSDQLRKIQNDYGAQFYLNTKQRPDLSHFLVHSNQSFYIYDIDLIK